jgi:hypothetical protein
MHSHSVYVCMSVSYKDVMFVEKDLREKKIHEFIKTQSECISKGCKM